MASTLFWTEQQGNTAYPLLSKSWRGRSPSCTRAPFQVVKFAFSTSPPQSYVQTVGSPPRGVLVHDFAEGNVPADRHRTPLSFLAQCRNQVQQKCTAEASRPRCAWSGHVRSAMARKRPESRSRSARRRGRPCLQVVSGGGHLSPRAGVNFAILRTIALVPGIAEGASCTPLCACFSS